MVGAAAPRLGRQSPEERRRHLVLRGPGRRRLSFSLSRSFSRLSSRGTGGGGGIGRSGLRCVGGSSDRRVGVFSSRIPSWRRRMTAFFWRSLYFACDASPCSFAASV